MVVVDGWGKAINGWVAEWPSCWQLSKANWIEACFARKELEDGATDYMHGSLAGFPWNGHSLVESMNTMFMIHFSDVAFDL